jgi:ABC-type amino acid transport substrate-binding protein
MHFSEPYYYTHQVIVQRKLADSLLIKDATAPLTTTDSLKFESFN